MSSITPERAPLLVSSARSHEPLEVDAGPDDHALPRGRRASSATLQRLEPRPTDSLPPSYYGGDDDDDDERGHRHGARRRACGACLTSRPGVVILTLAVAVALGVLMVWLNLLVL